LWLQGIETQKESVETLLQTEGSTQENIKTLIHQAETQEEPISMLVKAVQKLQPMMPMDL
jgi:hypothetical protein